MECKISKQKSQKKEIHVYPLAPLCKVKINSSGTNI